MAKPDESLFSINERDGEYYAEFEVRGRITVRIKAESLDAAKTQADSEEDKLWDESGDEVILDEVEDVRCAHVAKERRLFRVIRDGKPSQVSWLQDGDLPREPDERGF